MILYVKMEDLTMFEKIDSHEIKKNNACIKGRAIGNSVRWEHSNNHTCGPSLFVPILWFKRCMLCLWHCRHEATCDTGKTSSGIPPNPSNLKRKSAARPTQKASNPQGKKKFSEKPHVVIPLVLLMVIGD